jgi:hypothetical protein
MASLLAKITMGSLNVTAHSNRDNDLFLDPFSMNNDNSNFINNNVNNTSNPWFGKSGLTPRSPPAAAEAAPVVTGEEALLEDSHPARASSRGVLVDLQSNDGTRQSTPLLQQTKSNYETTPRSGRDAKHGDQSKSKPKKRSIKSRYTKAIFILEKIDKNAANGVIHPMDAADRIRYQAVVDEYHKFKDNIPTTSKDATKNNERAKRNRSQTEGDRTPKRKKVIGKTEIPNTRSSTTRRPFNEVVRDHLLVALANVHDGSPLPVVTEWGAIESKLAELVMKHVLSNKDSPAPRFDCGEIHRGYRIIRCMDGLSKEFLCSCITKISDAWEGLKLELIPAKDIPLRPRARIWLPKIEEDTKELLECLKLQNSQVPMDDWSVVRVEEPRKNSMSLVLAISEAGASALEKVGNKLFFGVREAKVKVFRQTVPNGPVEEEKSDANKLSRNSQLKEPPDKDETKQNDVECRSD